MGEESARSSECNGAPRSPPKVISGIAPAIEGVAAGKGAVNHGEARSSALAADRAACMAGHTADEVAPRNLHRATSLLIDGSASDYVWTIGEAGACGEFCKSR